MNRRDLLAGVPALAAAPVATAQAPARGPVLSPARADDLVRRYFAFGNKRSGGAGDRASGAWLEGELRTLGYRTQRQGFEAPFYEAETATLRIDGAPALAVLPQPPFRATAPNGVTARLMNWTGVGDPRGTIAVIALPFRRWSAFRAPEIALPVASALAGGAAAVAIVTTGPTGETLALNMDIAAPPFPAPVVLIGSRAGAALLSGANRGQSAQLDVRGAAGMRDAFNLLGRLDRGSRRSLVISTPRSAWTSAAGERGPGVAIWLALAAWARTLPDVDVSLLCTSGHEYDNAGGHVALKSGALPPPAQTAMWVHLGAAVATRDFHDLGERLSPLPSADPQRLLAASTPLLPLAARAFAGQPGLERAYDLKDGAEGELKEILAAGYGSVIGAYGALRFHHAAGDDLSMVEPHHVAAAATAFQHVIAEGLARRG